jgi:hypothetical protein
MATRTPDFPRAASHAPLALFSRDLVERIVLPAKDR